MEPGGTCPAGFRCSSRADNGDVIFAKEHARSRATSSFCSYPLHFMRFRSAIEDQAPIPIKSETVFALPCVPGREGCPSNTLIRSSTLAIVR
jgi:hypothetical protein